MQRRLAAKKKGRKVKTNRCHVKDGHLRCQAKQPMTKADTATFYQTMFGLGEEGKETEPVEEVEEEEILVEVVSAAPERGQKSAPKRKKKEVQKKNIKKKKENQKKKEKSAAKSVKNTPSQKVKVAVENGMKEAEENVQEKESEKAVPGSQEEEEKEVAAAPVE